MAHTVICSQQKALGVAGNFRFNLCTTLTPTPIARAIFRMPLSFRVRASRIACSILQIEANQKGFTRSFLP